MKLTTIFGTVAVYALTVAGTPLPTEVKRQTSCTILLTLEEDWVEAALHRFRIRPSISGRTWNLGQQLKDHWLRGGDAFLSQSTKAKCFYLHVHYY